MPPVLDPSKSKVDGLAFLGLSLARKSEVGHPESETHQTAFDLNEVLDRDYEFIFSTNDDGWLVGGGEPGPPKSYKLAAKDSAHVEIMRIGTYRKEWGGLPKEEIIKVMEAGEILIPQIEALPTAVVANPDKPPELEIRFDMEPEVPDFEDEEAPLPVNWQLRFLHNQLFKKFEFPSRFCPGAFHSTILRKAEFRSDEHREKYFEKCDAAVKVWREAGPQPLNTVKRDIHGKKMPPHHHHHHQHKPHEHPPSHHEPEPKPTPGPKSKPTPERPRKKGPPKPEEESPKPHEKKDAEKKEEEKTELPQSEEEFNSGIWLFDDRENITHFFEPNFLPPYNTPEKRKIILDVLKEEWDEKTLSWKPCGQGSMTKKKELVEEKDEKAPEPVSEAVPEPVSEPTPEPVSEPTTEPVSEPTPQPIPSKEETPESSEEEKKTDDEKTELTEEKPSTNSLVAHFDHIVGDVLGHVEVCCAPLGKGGFRFGKEEESKVA